MSAFKKHKLLNMFATIIFLILTFATVSIQAKPAFQQKAELNQKIESIEVLIEHCLSNKSLAKDQADHYRSVLERIENNMKLKSTNNQLSNADQLSFMNELDDLELNVFQSSAENKSQRDSNLINKIRKKLTESRSLSPSARTVNLMEVDGIIRMDGSVQSLQEKEVLESLIKNSGAKRVVSRLIIPQ